MASWDQIRNEVRSFRASVQPTVTTIRDFVFDSRHDRVYFLANDLTKSSKAPMLFRVDLPKPYSEDRDQDQDLDQDMDDEHDHTLFERDMESSSSYEDLSSDQDMGLVPFHPDTYQFAGPPSLHHTIPALIPGPRGSHSYHESNNTGSSFSFGKASSSSSPSGETCPGTPSLTDQILAAAPVLTWVPVLSEDWLKHAHATLHSPSERLSSFQFEPQVNRLMFPYGAAIYIGNVQQDGKVNPQPARPVDHGRASNLSRPPYAGVSQNALTASFNFVSVSGPLTSPRATGTGTPANVNSNPNSNCSSPKIDKGSPGGRNDPKLGGTDLDLIAFTRDQDIWVMTTSGIETQLTFCSRNSKKSAISCGIAEFVMQEEFHRFTNYYWAPSNPTKKSLVSPTSVRTSPISPSTPSQPQVVTPSSQSESSPLLTSGSSSPPILDSTGHTHNGTIPPSSKFSTRCKERILYLQVSEAMVDLVTISRQGMQPDHEEYRYPHAGTPNAASDLQIVEFVPKQYDEDHVGEPLHKRLWGRASLYKLFPWLEYIVRFGWLPDGESVWVQILDRRQQITAIVTIPLECFMSVAEQAESSEQVEDELASRIRVIYEEQSDCWINVTDIMHFFPTPRIDLPRDPILSANTIQFIISSETTGFRHLYLATHSTQAGLVMTPITSGDYQVVDKQITVDADRQLVYFIAKKDSVLETHLYVASYARGAPPDNVRRLTDLGFSHQVTVDVGKSRFLTLYSSIDQSPACAVMHLRWADCKASGLSAMPIEGVQDGSNAPWCSCGCQLPKISSHAFVIREGITNLSAKRIRQFPIVPAQGATNGHARSCSDSSMTRMDSQALSAPSGSTVNGFKSGSMNSISGFLASHLLSTHLLPSSRTIVQESMMVVSHGPNGSSAPTANNLSSSPTSNSWRGSLTFAPTHHPSGSSSSTSTSNTTAINAVHHPVGEFFTFMSSDNVKLHGCLYRPANYVEGQKYPTLVSIYGGPRSQMVTNEYKLPKFLRTFLATRLGLAVVMMDGRGSNDRGVAFESPLQHRMGQIEIQDQVEGLQFLAKPENGGLVDMERVAISGWSYGGYLSLMALAQYPEIFKVAIAGAPVTQWELYNSAYTERYMGLIHENKEAYVKSNVLSWADKFPDNDNRLLIAHGLIDENVHFTNTETLVADLVRFNKPHQIQLYPTERHGLRDARVNEHFETLMFFWLKNYL
ncbi:dipeptidylpeptidase [Podila horticola]|nr:dipeptidylpeptidase [Podila horticola]